MTSATGAVRHFVAKDGGEEELGLAASVLLAEGDGGFYLLRENEQGECVADTWHATLEEAKEQARFEFGIDDSAWSSA